MSYPLALKTTGLITNVSLNQQRIGARGRLGNLTIRALSQEVSVGFGSVFLLSQYTSEPVEPHIANLLSYSSVTYVVFDAIADTVPEEGGVILCI